MTSKILAQAIASGTLSGNSTDVVVSSNGAIQLAGNNGTDIFIAPNNNVGIGNTTPAYKLEVNGVGRFAGSPLYIGTGLSGSAAEILLNSGSDNNYSDIDFAANSVTQWRIGKNGGNYWGIWTGAGVSKRFEISNTGDVNIGATATAAGGLRYFDIYNTESSNTSSGAIIRLVTANSSGGAGVSVDMVKYRFGAFYLNNNDANGSISLGTAGGDRLYIAANGNVGVGTTSPSFKLHLSGTGHATSDFRAPIFYDSDNTTFYADLTSTGDSIISAGNIRLGSRLLFNTCDAFTGGSYALIGLSWGGTAGTYKNFAVYDYPNTRTMFTIDGQTRNAEIFGIAYAYASSRAPIFYDSDDTGYYTNPAATSNMYQINAGAGTQIIPNPTSGNAWLSTAAYGVSQGDNRTHLGYNSGGTYLNYIRGAYTTIEASTRSPVFYDSDDTGYYLDPNSTSDQALRIRGGAYFGPNVSWGRYLWVGTNGRPSDEASVCATDGNLHIDCMSGHTIYLNYYSNANVYQGGSGFLYSGTSIRAPIFYDTDDTAYYANLAGASRFSGIQSTGRSGNWNTDFQNTPADTFRYGGDLNAGTNGPTGGTGWWIQQNFRHSNSSNYWGVQVAWGWEDRANELYTRNVTGGSFGSWYRYWNSANAPGTVLQVVNTLKTDTFTSGTAETWIDVTGMSATITPKSSSSKIFVQIFVGRHYGTNSVVWRVLRNGSLYNAGASASNRQTVHGAESNQGRDGNHTGQFVIGYLDSPATTSAVTYQLQFRCESTNFTFNRNGVDSDITNSYSARSSSSIILMEIAG